MSSLVIKQRKGTLWLVSAPAITLVSILLFLLWPRPSQDDLARTGIESLERGDVTAILAGMSQEEAELVGATKDSLRTFVQDYYLPRMRGFAARGGATTERLDAQSMVLANKELRHPDGRVTYLSYKVVKTDHGLVSTDAIRHMVVAALGAAWPPHVPLPKGKARAQFFVRQLRSDFPILSATGIRGIQYMDPETGLMKLRSWSDWIDHLAKNIERQ